MIGMDDMAVTQSITERRGTGNRLIRDPPDEGLLRDLYLPADRSAATPLGSVGTT